MNYMTVAIRKGLSFGLTSGVITTLGLIIGLNSGTHSRLVVVSGILVIAVADGLSDAIGIHLSEETDKKSNKAVWQTTISTFCSKFVFALSFMAPVMLFPLNIAILISILYGITIVCVLTYCIQTKKNNKPWKMMLEHVILTCIVVIVSHIVGNASASISTLNY